MHPILIKIPIINLTIHTYGFLLATGFVIAIIYCMRMGKKENIDSKVMIDLIFWSIVVGLIGSKLFLLVTELKIYLQDPKKLLLLIRSAGTFYGGLIFGFLFAMWFIKKKKLPFGKLADILGPAVALAHFFGRLGCFSAGCCWGRACSQFPGVVFSNKDLQTGVPTGTLLYPTQLIEAILNLLNFFVLFLLYKKRKFAGQIFIIYIFNYSLIRFSIEYFRGDLDRGYIFGAVTHPFTSLSVPQLISVIGIILALIIYRIASKKQPKG